MHMCGLNSCRAAPSSTKCSPSPTPCWHEVQEALLRHTLMRTNICWQAMASLLPDYPQPTLCISPRLTKLTLTQRLASDRTRQPESSCRVFAERLASSCCTATARQYDSCQHGCWGACKPQDICKQRRTQWALFVSRTISSSSSSSVTASTIQAAMQTCGCQVSCRSG